MNIRGALVVPGAAAGGNHSTMPCRVVPYRAMPCHATPLFLNCTLTTSFKSTLIISRLNAQNTFQNYNCNFTVSKLFCLVSKIIGPLVKGFLKPA